MAHPTLTEIQVVAKATLQLAAVIGYGSELHAHVFDLLPQPDQEELKRVVSVVSATGAQASGVPEGTQAVTPQFDPALQRVDPNAPAAVI